MLTKEDLELFDTMVKKNLETERIHTIRIVNDAKEEIRTEITVAANEAREELKAEIEAAKLEIRADIISLNSKIITKVQNHERSIRILHEDTEIPDPNKH